MKKAKELYKKDNNQNSYWGDFWYDYQPMLDEFGEIIIQEDEEDYQGSTFVLYKLSNGKYGFLNFGWGSCSGCDALRACCDIQGVQMLMDSLFEDIKEFDTLEDVKTYFNDEETRKLSYFYHTEEFVRFAKRVKEL